jgi:hypothetical protein
MNLNFKACLNINLGLRRMDQKNVIPSLNNLSQDFIFLF